MKIVISGVEPQYKVYKMSECVDHKFYIGKTKKPIKERMNGHKHGDHGERSADAHFADVGWRNVTVEIIDTANDEEELNRKEKEHIIKNHGPMILNRHFCCDKRTTLDILSDACDILFPCKKPAFVRVWSDDLKAWDILMKNT